MSEPKADLPAEQVVFPTLPPAHTEKSGSPQPPYRETFPVLSDEILQRYGARVLDPATAAQPGIKRREADNRRSGKSDDPLAPIRYLPTAYIADQVLISSRSLINNTDSPNGLSEALNETLQTLEVQLVPVKGDIAIAESRLRSESPAYVRYNVRSMAVDSTKPPDAFRVVQQLRDAPEELDVSLNHLMFGAVGGQTFSIGHGIDGTTFSIGHAAGPAEYAVPGSGGRAPVRWLGGPPHRSQVKSRRPVVAVLDTGVAQHPWFDDPADPVVTRLGLDAQGNLATVTDGSGGEEYPNLIDPLEGIMDAFFGHGTFIAGLVRQNCPDANIVSVKIMATDGIVDEWTLLNALGAVAKRQKTAQASSKLRKNIVDVVSLSLGYYHEDDAAGVVYDTKLSQAVDDLAGCGVLVVAAAGNNSTNRPLLPAALTPYSDGVLTTATNGAPLVSVGALNPDGSIALFSNGGGWVSCHCPGAALVSTLPFVDAGAEAGVAVGEAGTNIVAGSQRRSTIDPDSFKGFGTWSGTSFAAPVMAGAAAQKLREQDDLNDFTRENTITRVKTALEALGFPNATKPDVSRRGGNKLLVQISETRLLAVLRRGWLKDRPSSRESNSPARHGCPSREQRPADKGRPAI